MKRKLTLSSAAAVLLALAGCAEEQKPAPTAAADAAKAQAEADGNGRTGRVLNSFFLVEQDLLPLPILPFDRKIIAHKADYYRLLLAVTREGAWEPWLPAGSVVRPPGRSRPVSTPAACRLGGSYSGR